MPVKRKIPKVNKKNFPYPLVRIYWEDIIGETTWSDIVDIKKSKTAICCSVGWLPVFLCLQGVCGCDVPCCSCGYCGPCGGCGGRCACASPARPTFVHADAPLMVPFGLVLYLGAGLEADSKNAHDISNICEGLPA